MMLDSILENLRTLGNKASYINSEGITSYSEFYSYVSNIYHFLLNNNAGRLPVVIIGHKETYFRAAMLASSFAGMTYVPIDSHTPLHRINEMITSVGDAFIIGALPSRADVSPDELEDVMRKSHAPSIERIFMKPDDTYYIIFTSGSSGEPKGVMVSYKNVDSCIRWVASLGDIWGKVVANQGDFSFDLSVADLYGSLFSGGTQLALEKNSDGNIGDMVSFFRGKPLEWAVFTPSFVDLLLLDKHFCSSDIPSLEGVIFCGERLRDITVTRLRECFPSITIINCYGPTEATFAVTSAIIEEGGEISLGYAKEGVDIIIADEEMNVIPDGEVGEIVIIGDSVAKGYLSGEVGGFFEYCGRNAYKTGDLGRLRCGELFFVGRADSQIKYKGYRIELDDIEKNITALPFVEYAFVYTKSSADGRVLKLYADVKLKRDNKIAPREIAGMLSERLPSYMIPIVRIIDEITLSTNGKYTIGAEKKNEKTHC